MQGERRFFSAVKSGELKEVEACLNEGTDINCIDPFTDMTALQIAASDSLLRLLNLLISRDAELELTDSRGRTALHLAAEAIRYEVEGRDPSAEIIDALLNAGASITAINHAGETSLHCAVSHNKSAAAINKLIDSEGINLEDSSGYTPLMDAVVYANSEALKCLLAAKNDEGKLLLDINYASNKLGHKTALHLAAQRGEMEVIALLLEAGAQIDLADETGDTALHHAASGTNLEAIAEIMAALVKAGADINAKNSQGKTPLQILKSGPQKSTGTRVSPSIANQLAFYNSLSLPEDSQELIRRTEIVETLISLCKSLGQDVANSLSQSVTAVTQVVAPVYSAMPASAAGTQTGASAELK